MLILKTRYDDSTDFGQEERYKSDLQVQLLPLSATQTSEVLAELLKSGFPDANC